MKKITTEKNKDNKTYLKDRSDSKGYRQIGQKCKS
jgi:hypothetical protein